MSKKAERPEVKLSDTDGNLQTIISRCKKAYLESGFTEEDWGKLFNEMLSEDAENLMLTIKINFKVV